MYSEKPSPHQEIWLARGEFDGKWTPRTSHGNSAAIGHYLLPQEWGGISWRPRPRLPGNYLDATARGISLETTFPGGNRHIQAIAFLWKSPGNDIGGPNN